MTRTWFITGANRGLGYDMAKAALEAGDNVVATARDIAGLTQAFGASPHFLAVPLEVTDPVQIDSAVGAAQARFGRIDVLVNNAGYGQYGWFETVSDAQIRAQFDTNVHGVMNVTRAILPIMRAQRSGHVLSITSIAGIVGSPGFSAYCASKFAVEGWMQALAFEINPLGIRTTLVEPGPFKTDFLDDSSLKRGLDAIEDYAEVAQASRERFAKANHQQPGDPARFAQAMLAIVAMEAPPLHFPAGAIAVETLVGKARALQDDAEANLALSIGTDAEAPD